MTLPASPPISMSQVATELGVSRPLSLSASNVRTLAGKPTGNISLLDLLGKSAATPIGNLINGHGDGDAVWGFSDGNFSPWTAPDDPVGAFGAFTDGSAGHVYQLSTVAGGAITNYALYIDNGGLAGHNMIITIGASSQTITLGAPGDGGGGISVYFGAETLIFYFAGDGLSYNVSIT